MTAQRLSAFPDAALSWLVGPPGGHVLALGRTCAPLMPPLDQRGDRLTAVDADAAGVRRMLARAPHALPTVSQPDHLPFVPGAFDVALICQSLHTLDPARVLPELARVLRPGGQLAITYTVRDDSVPWVRRLVTLMRSIDPEAMTGDYGSDSLHALDASAHFPVVDHKEFRLWTPITRDGMLGLVRRRYAGLDADRVDPLLAGVAALYDDAARAPEPLLLPYRVACWRATVDHSEFTSGLTVPDDGMPISLAGTTQTSVR